MDKLAFEQRVIACANDAAALAGLAVELEAMNEVWARPMLFRVIFLKRKAAGLSSQTHQKQLSSVGIRESLAWAAQIGLPPPDGRPLYRYRLSAIGFLELEGRLLAGVAKHGINNANVSAIFVLWAAEWFRRCFKGGMQRWADLGDRLQMHCDQAEWREIADRGLRWWGIAPLRLGGQTHRLLALARQGGFPIAALDGDRGGWATQYLGKLVGVLLAEADATIEVAFRHAQRLGVVVPESWRHDDVFTVSADLALSIVALRRDAEAGAAAANLPTSVWLDLHRPNWRDDLPLVVEGDDGGRLLDGLMRTAAIKGGSGAVRASRSLEQIGGRWRERLRFDLNGTLKGVSLGSLDNEWGRLRVFATGALARFVPGELAVIEAGEDGEWIAVASRSGQAAFDVPFNVPVEIELRGAGRRIGPTIVLANGRIAGALLVFADAGTVNGDQLVGLVPDRLTLVGSASGKYVAEPIYALIPDSWSLGTGENESATKLAAGIAEGRDIWLISGGAVVTSLRGDHYRLWAGQAKDDRDTMTLQGVAPSLCTSGDIACPLFCGVPVLLLRERGRDRAPLAGETWCRRLGEHAWRPLSRFAGAGSFEFAWRDTDTGHIRDRQVALILPADFKVDLCRSASNVALTVHGWPGNITVQPGIKIDAQSWRVATKETIATSARIKLESIGLPVIELNVPLPHNAWISDWVSGPLAVRSRLALGDLHRYVARSPGRCELMAQLLDRHKRRVPQAEMRWIMEDELPLSAIRDDLAALLRPLADLDATIELDFNDGHEDYWYVAEFEVTLVPDPTRGLTPSRAILDEHAVVAGRSLGQPCHEVVLAEYGLAECLDCRPIPVPDEAGNWLLYIKSHDRVLSRPFLHAGDLAGPVPSDVLGRAMAFGDWRVRKSALSELITEATQPGRVSRATVRAVIDLAASLDGLPPSTFDVLSLLAVHPEFAARLLFESTGTELPSIMALANGLPFAWPLISAACWQDAAMLRADALIQELSGVIDNAITVAMHEVASTSRAIAMLDPSLASPLGLAVEVVSLEDAAQGFMQRSHDRAESFASSPFRPERIEFLPSWKFGAEYWRALDAPVAAALAAAGQIRLEPPELRCVKDVARRHPRYFEQAFATSFKECRNG